MRLLTATSTGQGALENDFTFATEGELVIAGLVCVRDEEDPDGGCGCGRSFVGLNSGRGTTMAMIREVAISEGDLRLAIEPVFRQWLPEPEDAQELKQLVEEFTAEAVELGGRWPVGTLIARRLDDITPRW